MDIASSLNNLPYLAWAVGISVVFYKATDFATSHLHKDRKAALSLWLEGSYQSTWSTHFCNVFDRLFGENHFAPRCLALSAVVSILAVLAIWVVLDPILGLISLRAESRMTLTQALLLGAAINVVPDYLSLYETRWLLKIFERVRHPLLQFGVLLLDALVTGAIIYFAVKLYVFVTATEPVSAIEMIALFSIYAVFFYSTFVTSVWAWGFCLSSWFVRLSASLRGWLDFDEAPGRALALLSAGVVLIGAVALRPLLVIDERGLTRFDAGLCALFPATACMHAARLTADEQQKLDFLGKACLGGITEECLATGLAIYQIKPAEAKSLWERACREGSQLRARTWASSSKKASGSRRTPPKRRRCTGAVATRASLAVARTWASSSKKASGSRRTPPKRRRCTGAVATKKAAGSRRTPPKRRRCTGAVATRATLSVARTWASSSKKASGSRRTPPKRRRCTDAVATRATLAVARTWASSSKRPRGRGGRHRSGDAVPARLRRGRRWRLHEPGLPLRKRPRGRGGRHERCTGALATRATLAVARTWENGLGVEADATEAATLYRLHEPGRGCHRRGDAVPTRPRWRSWASSSKKASGSRRTHRRGCDEGDARGCTNLGVLFEKGSGSRRTTTRRRCTGAVATRATLSVARTWASSSKKASGSRRTPPKRQRCTGAVATRATLAVARISASTTATVWDYLRILGRLLVI